MSEQKKVYCGDCRFYRNGPTSLLLDMSCKIPDGRYDGYKKKNIKNYKYSCAINKNKKNDCQDYKRKWWKFWL